MAEMSCPSCTPIGESTVVRCSVGRKLSDAWCDAIIAEGSASDESLKKYASASTRTADRALLAEASTKTEAAWADLNLHIDTEWTPQESPATARHG